MKLICKKDYAWNENLVMFKAGKEYTATKYCKIDDGFLYEVELEPNVINHQFAYVTDSQKERSIWCRIYIGDYFYTVEEYRKLKIKSLMNETDL